MLKHLSVAAGTAFLFALLSAGCSKPPVYPAEPVIEYVGVNQTTIRQSSGTSDQLDTLIISFSFTDGDGDLGSPDSINVFLTDNRDGFSHPFKINRIPQLGAGNGIMGQIDIKLTNSPDTKYFCCTYPNTNLTCIPNPQYPTDTMSYSIQLRDRAGNLSNIITTEPIILLCE